MSTLQLYFLGPAKFSRGTRSVELSSTKAVALLAYLAITGAPQSRDHLTDLLWPDSLPDAARKNLRNTLWAIRKALGDNVLHSDGDRMTLADPVWCDVTTFAATIRTVGAQSPPREELQTAVDLYRAPVLDGLILADAPDYEIWLATERERFGQLYLRGLEALVTTHHTASRWDQVIATARRALAADNLQEPMYRALMEAHALQGERPEALRQYDLLRTTLAHELGVEPLPETEQLREAILGGNLQPRPHPATVLVRPRRSPRPGQPFVGRQVELAALDAALKRAAGGHAQVVLLTGELGIGKSRLWQEWSATLPSTLIVLESRCLDTTQLLPFAPLTGLFSESACVEQLFKPPSPVSPIWLAELTRLLPEIRNYWPAIPAPPILPSDEERRRLFEAFTQTLRALVGQPLILFIDDLHWGDQATLDWLVYLIDRLRGEPLLLVGTYRISEASTTLAHVVANWGRAGVVQRLPLSRLTLEESFELISQLGGDVTAIEQLQQKSAGNPYFLIELYQAGPNHTPPGLAELIRARLSQLPETARQVLQAAAVLDAGFDFATLRRTSGRGEEETLNALDALLETAVLDERAGAYDFTHPLVAAVVREDFSLARRSFLHRRAAVALEAIFAGRLESIAGQLATHYAQAGHPSQAAHYAELAAKHALKLAAHYEAASFYRQAYKLEPTPARELGLGRALNLQGDIEKARQVFEAAAAKAEAEDNQAGMAQAYLAMADTFLPTGDGELITYWAEKALRYLGSQPVPEVDAHVHHLLGAGKLRMGLSLTEAETHLMKAAQLAIASNQTQIAARSYLELGNLLAQRGNWPAAQEAFGQSVAVAHAAEDYMEELLGHNNLAYHAMLAGDLTTAHQHIELGLAMAETNALFFPRQFLFSTRGEIALADGTFDEAESWFKRALKEAERLGNQAMVTNIRANLGLVARERGQLDEALLLLEAAQTEVTTMTAPHLQTQIELWLAELYLQRGERAAAEEALSRAEAFLASSQLTSLADWAARVRADLERAESRPAAS